MQERSIQARRELQIELQGLVTEQNASLPESIKRQYSPLSWKEILETFPTQWVALVPTKIELGRYPLEVEGRVLAHGNTLEEFSHQLQLLREKYTDPIIGLVVRNTGQP